MVTWLNLLKTDKIVYNYILIFTTILFVLVFFSPFYSGAEGTIIQIIISILVSIVTAILILFFSNYQYVIFKLNTTFQELYDEILDNKKRLEEKFNSDCSTLEIEWKKGIRKIGGGEGKWLPKLASEYGQQNEIISKYYWRYLMLHPYYALTNASILDEIKGFGFDIELISTFWSYPKICHIFCDTIQELESQGNIFSFYIGKCKENGVTEILIPEIKLIKNHYVSDSPKLFKIVECEEEISRIIQQMLKVKSEFMIDFNYFHEFTNHSNKRNFLIDLLKLNNSKDQTKFGFFITANHSYFAFLLATIIVFALFTIFNIQGLCLDYFKNLIIKNWYWGFLWFLLFAIIFYCKSPYHQSDQ
jgi:hypothetical protein